MKRLNNKAQTIVELGIFGSILIFTLGLIIRSTLNFGLVQNQTLRATRMALSLSFRDSNGFLAFGRPRGDGTVGRTVATVLLIEDRLSPTSGKYLSADRNPFIVGGSGMHSRNLFMPTDPGEEFNEPVYDIFVNGKHIPIKVARLSKVPVSELNPATNLHEERTDIFEQIPNNYTIGRFCASGSCGGFTADQRFDLDRSGDIDSDEDVPATGEGAIYRTNFMWQWEQITVQNLRDQDTIYADVDNDLKEERIIRVDNLFIHTVDSQLGDMDFTLGTGELQERPGLENDVAMYTKQRDGTFLLIEEGAPAGLKDKIRTTTKKDHIDLVERTIRLSNNTGRFCSTRGVDTGGVNGEMRPTLNGTKEWPFDEDQGSWIRQGIRNPVEACNLCYSQQNIDKTCMDTTPGALRLHVRSRIYEGIGHQWVTDRSNDPYVPFPSSP